MLTTDKTDVAVVSTPDFILSPRKASFTFPPWTTFILKGVAVSFHYFFIFLRIRAVSLEARKSKGELNSPPACPHLEAGFGAVLSCFLWPMQQLEILPWPLLAGDWTEREETLEVTGFNFPIWWLRKWKFTEVKLWSQFCRESWPCPEY